MDKKQAQLGMNPSTAQQRLVKDTLFRLAVEAGHKCYHCGGLLVRETFSIEHKIPWLDDCIDPKALFFDQSNIAFSHLSCNISKARKTNALNLSDEERREYDKKYSRDRGRRLYTTEARQEKYRKHGY